jgi:lysophospholipase L1-like esterase
MRRVTSCTILLLGLVFSALRAELTLADKVRALPGAPQGPFVRAGDGTLWGVDEKGALVSGDEGKTWESRPIFEGTRFKSRPERALLRTKEGVMLYAFLNDRERVFKWDDKRGGPQEGCRLPVYVSRSDDDGKSWAAPQLLQEGWCGAVRQMIQLRSCRIVLVSQQAVANPGRHVTIVYTSDDLGKSWQAGSPLDLGVSGNYADQGNGITGSTHGGGLEGTVVETTNGELRMLLRVPHGYFHELTSRDGTKWSAGLPSTIEASDSPGMLTRLASGRVVLVWNRYRDPVKRTGRREELSIAFSENDGITWTMPQIVAANPTPEGKRESAYWISYPYVFEPTPGRLWISTMQGGLRVELDERDFLAPVQSPPGGRAVRILTLGDSITRGARPGVPPAQTFPALVATTLRAHGVPAQVHGVGIGSERTDLALRRLDRDVISQHPDLVTVMYGTNDSWVDAGQAESRRSEKQYAEDLRAIVERLKAAGIQVVLMTAPRFGEENRRNGLGEDPNVRLAIYMEQCRAVAQATHVPLVDHFAAWTAAQAGGRRLQPWTTDGCHPNPLGHADLAERMTATLEPLARRLSAQP